MKIWHDISRTVPRQTFVSKLSSNYKFHYHSLVKRLEIKAMELASDLTGLAHLHHVTRNRATRQIIYAINKLWAYEFIIDTSHNIYLSLF